MLPEAQQQVRFDIPMDTDDESIQNVESVSSSNPGGGNQTFFFGIGPPPPPRFNLGMDVPMSAVPSESPKTQQPFNLGFNRPIEAAQHTPPPPSIQQPFNFGFPPSLASTPPQAAPAAAPVQQPFNFGFPPPLASTPPQAVPTAAPVQPFNLGFKLPIQARQDTPPPPSTQQPFNFGFPAAGASTPPQVAPPAGTVKQPFNLGFHLPVPSHQLLPAANRSPQALNLGFNIPILPVGLSMQPEVAPPVQGTSLRVCYDINNKPFHFGCKPPSPMGEWQPEPIRAPAPMPVPAVAMPVDIPADQPPASPVINPAIYNTIKLPNIKGTPTQPTLASLVGDAEQAAIDIVRRLGGEEFDQLAQQMVGGILGPEDAVRDPKPDEVLDSNRVMLGAFCESRDRLTRIFKDLISLHHIAQAHERVIPAVHTLLQEVEQAEAKTADSK